MLPVLPAAVLLLIIDMLPWSDQAALSSTSRDMHQVLRPFVRAHTSRLLSIIRNWTSRSLPPCSNTSQAVSWPVALQSAGCLNTCTWRDAISIFFIAVAPLLTVHMGFLCKPTQLAGQLALKVHRALWKCPFLRNIYTQALSKMMERRILSFFLLVYFYATDNKTEFRRWLGQLLSHLYRQQALHILAKPDLRSIQSDFRPESAFSKSLHAHLSHCFSLTGLQ